MTRDWREPFMVVPRLIPRGPRHRYPTGERKTPKEYRQAATIKRREERIKNIAILDMETDPFDNTNDNDIRPFLAVLYRDDANPVVIWQEHQERFVDEVLAAIESLPGRYRVFAHNGGRFDYMFLVHRLRGRVSFKGRSLMCAKIGEHELRDSFHIIPERLANWQKENFDYNKMKRCERGKHKAEIIRYCISDCEYLLQLVKAFVTEYGMKLSIGQAAQSVLRSIYKVQNLGSASDELLRGYFFGGRVECLAGKGVFSSADGWSNGDAGLCLADSMGYALYDVNSMYPYVMAEHRHPVGNSFTVRRGNPRPGKTVFMELTCRNFGGLIARGEEGETTSEILHGTFKTTIWEYEMALRYKLIDRVQIHKCIDFEEQSTFKDFVVPLYERRRVNKLHLVTLREGSPEFFNAKRDDIFLKLILNNAYGKFAQNPRNYKECYLTGPDEMPGIETISKELRATAKQFNTSDADLIRQNWGLLPRYECKDYLIWERPQQYLRFRNVATAASITGAARAKLLEAIQLARDPIYCDTDSLICRGFDGVHLDNAELGAWKKECEIDRTVIAGKKLYAYEVAGYDPGHPKRVAVRSKGVAGLTWNDIVEILHDDIRKVVTASGRTLFKQGGQEYMRREIRSTAPIGARAIIRRKAKRWTA